MPTLYNKIANQSLDRLAAPSDGIFPVAMTAGARFAPVRKRSDSLRAGTAGGAVDALLCVIGTRWSIGFILAVQIQYAIAPRWPKRNHTS